jgi:hypothetical protein
MPQNNNALLALARNAGLSDSDTPTILHIVNSTDSPDASTEKLLADFGHATDAANLLIAHQQCPPEFRAFIDAVIGARSVATSQAAPDAFIEINDATLAKRAGHSTKWVQEWRNKLRDWQNKNDVSFIDIKDHYREPDGTSHAHAYRVHIDRLAIEAMLEARSTAQWTKDPHGAMEGAARNVGERTPNFQARKQKKRAKRSDAEIAESKLRQAAKLIEAVADSIGFNATWPDDTTLEKLRQSVDKLSAALRGEPEKDISTQYSSNRVEVENGGVVENFSTRHDLVESTVYEKQGDTGGAGRAVEKSDAERAIEAFESIGADVFQVVMRNEATGSGAEETHDDISLRKHLPHYMERNAAGRESLIIRPIAERRMIQVDEANPEVLQLLAPVSFLQIATSAGNGQAWIALEGIFDDEAYRALRDRLLRRLKPLGTNGGAYGAMRWPGSLNCKPSRRCPDGSFPKVTLLKSSPGRVVSINELEKTGLLAPVSSPLSKPQIQDRQRANRAPKRFPDYNVELERAARKSDGAPDRSHADINFAIRCIKWGWSESETATRLHEVSDKAKHRRGNYAERTVRRASQIVAGGAQ